MVERPRELLENLCQVLLRICHEFVLVEVKLANVKLELAHLSLVLINCQRRL